MEKKIFDIANLQARNDSQKAALESEAAKLSVLGKEKDERLAIYRRHLGHLLVICLVTLKS